MADKGVLTNDALNNGQWRTRAGVLTNGALTNGGSMMMLWSRPGIRRGTGRDVATPRTPDRTRARE